MAAHTQTTHGIAEKQRLLRRIVRRVATGANDLALVVGVFSVVTHGMEVRLRRILMAPSTQYHRISLDQERPIRATVRRMTDRTVFLGRRVHERVREIDRLVAVGADRVPRLAQQRRRVADMGRMAGHARGAVSHGSVDHRHPIDGRNRLLMALTT